MEIEKKHICFICASEFPCLETYKLHIINGHKEGTDYILCPYCNYPCRDVKSHWRVKHPNYTLPSLPRYRATKLVDWDNKYRQEKNKKNKWKDGFFNSNKMGKEIHYRSSWERDIMICLEKCDDILEYHGDDFLSIPYKLHGVPKNYWPDFTIKLSNNRIYVIEIKPENQVDWQINQAKWKYAIDYCSKKDWTFQVWTQKYIRKIKTRAVRNDKLILEDIFPNEEDLNEINQELS
mgnify:CR=1 FL=1